MGDESPEVIFRVEMPAGDLADERLAEVALTTGVFEEVELGLGAEMVG